MRKRLAAVIAATCLVAVGSSTRDAKAQQAGFAVDRFDPSERGSDWFVLESLDLRGPLRPAIGIVGDYAYRPLAFYDANGNVVSSLVQDQLFVHVGMSAVISDRLRLGISGPVALFQDGNGNTIGGQSYAPPGSASVGDLRFGADVRIFGTYGEVATMAAGVQLYAPIGSRTQYTGDGEARVVPRLLFAGDSGNFAYAAKVAFQYRSLGDSFGGAHLGSEVPFAVSVGVRLAERRLLVGPELFGSTVVTSPEGAFQTSNTPLEAILGMHYRAGDEWRIGAGAGGGLTRGFGAPTFRALLSVEWVLPLEKAPPPPPEPKPERPDRDGDGVFDDEDACPDDPGVRTDDPKTNGCPPDRDKDGVPDAKDACPDTPGVKTDDPKTNGCPPDRDKDGIPDAEDACPDEPGVKTADPKTNGCPPDPDRDKDGIPNEQDACPDEPGPRDPDPKRNGCPKAFVKDNQIKILDQVKFKTGSAQILPGKDSQEVLDAVLAVLQKHTEIVKVRVEGHTDNVGAQAMNKKLSQDRAASVVKWLVAHGVDAARLSSAGFGLERPIADNATAEGRKENRRVEFHIEP
jgi:outer membrane protein OmpA-like peptidoglycan-associated protein